MPCQILWISVVCLYVCVCVWVCVCVCGCVCVCVCVTYISSSSYATTPILNSSVFLLPSVPSYTPTPISPLLYADNRSSPFPLPYNRPFLSFPFCLPRFSHARAQEVTSPLHPSDLVAAKCAPLCREGRGGAGCWTSLLLATYLPSQSHTFPSIPTSACSWVTRLTSSVRLRPPLRVFRPQSRTLE